MSNNNLNHISDLSKFKIFDPTGTQWDSSVKDVQTALSKIGSWAMVGKGLPVASTTVQGIIRIATQDQVNTGTDNNSAVTPATLNVRLQRPAATTAVAGITRYATNAEALTGTVSDAAIVPSSLDYVFDSRPGTETNSGTVKLTTDSQAKAGTDTTTAVTPQRVKQMIALFSPTQVSYNPASNSVLGVVYLANAQQTAQGTLDTGYAVSPKSLMATTASPSKYGLIRTATQDETNAGGADDLAVSPKTLSALTATNTRPGVIKLTANPTTDSSYVAYAANTVFTSRKINGKALTGDITLNSDDVNAYSKSDSDGRYKSINSRDGNFTTVAAGTYIGAGSGYSTRSPNVAGTSTLMLSMTVKFKFQSDGFTINRNLTYQLKVNGSVWETHTLTANKAESHIKGDVYFEGYATQYHQLNNIPQNALVEVVPISNAFADNYSTSCIFTTN